MKLSQEPIETRTDQQPPREWIHLILKLRWMGLADDARSLEFAVSTLPSDSDSHRPARSTPSRCRL
jgi:hypothetical protein